MEATVQSSSATTEISSNLPPGGATSQQPTAGVSDIQSVGGATRSDNQDGQTAAVSTTDAPATQDLDHIDVMVKYKTDLAEMIEVCRSHRFVKIRKILLFIFFYFN